MQQPVPVRENMFELFDEPTLVNFMCNLSVPNMIKLAKVSKRFRDVYQDETFIKKCVEKNITPHQRVQRALHSMKSEIKKDSDGVYSIEARGKTAEGVVYDIALYSFPGIAPYIVMKYYESRRTLPKKAPEFRDEEEKKQWFLSEYKDYKIFYANGDITFEFPVVVLSYDVVKLMVEEITYEVMRKFERHMDMFGIGPYHTQWNGVYEQYALEFQVSYVVNPESESKRSVVDYLKEHIKADNGVNLRYDISELLSDSRARFEHVRDKAIVELSQSIAQHKPEPRREAESKGLESARTRFAINQIDELIPRLNELLKSMDRSQATKCVHDIREALDMIKKVRKDGPESVEFAQAEEMHLKLLDWFQV